MKSLINWLFLVKTITSREGRVHFRRWRLLATPWFSVFIHQIARSDEDEHPHDHPFAFRTFILRGGYTEAVWVPVQGYGGFWERIPDKTYLAGSTVAHGTNDFHKITLVNDKPAWTLVFAGPRTHTPWGYLLDDQGKWLSHTDYRKLKHPRSTR